MALNARSRIRHYFSLAKKAIPVNPFSISYITGIMERSAQSINCVISYLNNTGIKPINQIVSTISYVNTASERASSVISANISYVNTTKEETE